MLLFSFLVHISLADIPVSYIFPAFLLFGSFFIVYLPFFSLFPEIYQENIIPQRSGFVYSFSVFSLFSFALAFFIVLLDSSVYLFICFPL